MRNVLDDSVLWGHSSLANYFLLRLDAEPIVWTRGHRRSF